MNLAKECQGFSDLDKIQEIIESVNKSTNEDGIEKCLEEFKKTIEIYSQQPQLLDPYLGSLIEKLTSALEPGTIRYKAIFKILYDLIVVSGFKNACQKFPHEVDKLTVVVDLLAKENPEDKSNWVTRYVLTVWLSILVLAPFDLKKFDTNDEEETISKQIYTLLIRNFNHHDSCQQVTAYCLSQFFSRNDIIKSDYVENFFNQALIEIKHTKIDSANSTDDIKLIGYLRTLAYMYKFLPRSEMKSRSPTVLRVITDLDLPRIDRILVNHMIIKLVQRAGLSLLPARLANWRYKRAARLIGTLREFSDVNESIGDLPREQAANLQINDSQTDTNDYAEEQESIKYIETILSTLFLAAQNAQTRIRWSAAKGIARAASRLSKQRAGDIIDMVTDAFFKSDSNECAWHGGCLILAEMSRHGLILEEKLERVLMIVKDAIIYDKIKGSMATGAHIREAACYICWAMSRTYENHILKPYISALSANLLCDMLFDRELQCRRAASAAFQELIGRQGAFSQEEIGLLTDLDYHNVGQRQFAYLHLAPLVAKQGDKYVEPFVEHLTELKVAHWDIEIRRLASKAVAAIMLHYPQEKVKSYVLPRLIEMCDQNDDNNMKHGAILSLANVLESLVQLNYEFDSQLVEFVGSLAEKCDKQFKSKQLAPKFIEAIVQLIKSSEKANLKFSHDSKTVAKWEQIVMSSLDNDSSDIRQIGADACLSIYRGYYSADKSSQDRLLTTLNKTLDSPNENSRCGALMALSRLSQVPSVLFGDGDSSRPATIRRDADTTDIVLMSLAGYISKATHEPKPQEFIFAKAKAEACDSLARFIRNLDDTSLVTSNNLIQAGFDALLEKTEDYTFDKRGDIGVVVRQAAIRALQDITLFLLARNRKCIFEPERCTKLVSKVLQQAISYHDSCREIAGKCFYQLVACDDMPFQLVPHKSRIVELFKRFEVDETFEWRHQSAPVLINLLPKPEFSRDLWKGLISAVGQLSVIGARQFKVALGDYLRTLDSDGNTSTATLEDRRQVFESLMDALENIKPNDRSLMAALSLFDFLLTEGLLDESLCGTRLADYCQKCMETSDIKRLMAIVRILTNMFQFTEGAQIEALRHVSTLMTSQYERVRAHVADQLYSSLLTYGFAV